MSRNKPVIGDNTITEESHRYFIRHKLWPCSRNKRRK